MKKYYNRVLVFMTSFLMLIACQEDEKNGPFFNDGTAPLQVTNVEVENIPGGAKITYNIPDESDLLYIEASYKRDNGELATARASVFTNSLTVDGLRVSNTQDVKLITVDQGNNRSEPVLVSIAPIKAPIDIFYESLVMKPTFGGVRINFDNSFNTRIELQLYEEILIDGEKVDVYRQSAFLENGDIESHIFRGFDSTEATFKVAAIDRWDNVTDRLAGTVTPLLEVMLDESKFGVNVLPTDGNVLECCGGNFFVDQLWDDSVGWPNVYHTNDVASDPIPAIPPYTQKNLIAFTIDLGQDANLSRMKLFPRPDGGFFTRGNPRLFEVWGVKEIPADNGASFEGWSLLIKDGEMIKPSGAPLGQESSEDRAAAEAGLDFPTDSEPVVRYVRVVTLKNWEGSQWVHLGEIEFFGKPID